MFVLRRQSFFLRLAVTALVLVLGGGYAASLAHLEHHYSNKDEREGLSMDDLVGSYHGVNQPSLLKSVLEGDHGAEHTDPAQLKILTDWLSSEKVAEAYDELLTGQDISPADVLDMQCVDCHDRNPDAARLAAGEISDISLSNWPDIKGIAFTREINPVAEEILLISTHTHASSIPLIALAAGVLMLGTRLWRPLRDFLIALACVGLFVDLGSMWLARDHVAWVWGIVLGGGAFGVGLTLQFVVILVDMWLIPRGSDSE